MHKTNFYFMINLIIKKFGSRLIKYRLIKNFYRRQTIKLIFGLTFFYHLVDSSRSVGNQEISKVKNNLNTINQCFVLDAKMSCSLNCVPFNKNICYVDQYSKYFEVKIVKKTLK